MDEGFKGRLMRYVVKGRWKEGRKEVVFEGRFYTVTSHPVTSWLSHSDESDWLDACGECDGVWVNVCCCCWLLIH